MRTYNVMVQGKRLLRCATEPMPKEVYPAIEATSEHDALERAMFLYEMTHPLDKDALFWRSTINGVDFRLFWFLSFEEDNWGRMHSNYPRGRGIGGGIDLVPSREE